MSDKTPILYEQTSMFGEADNDNGGGFIVAFGRRLHVEQWSHVHGVDAQTIRSRLRSGWTPERAVSEAYQPTNKRQSDAFTVPWFSAGSWTWDWLPYDIDYGAQDFVVKHKGGAIVELCCEAMGLEDSQFRATEQQALMKLRGMVIDDVDGARQLFVDTFGEDALESLLERYQHSAPSLEDVHDGDAEPDHGELFEMAA